MASSSNYQNADSYNTALPYDPSQVVSVASNHSESHNQQIPAHGDVQHAFQNASNFVANNCSTNYIRNTINVGTDILMSALWPHVASGAMFDSATQPERNCHPGTRTEIVKRIDEWARDPTAPILWLHGPAGAGKSTIASTVCKLLGPGLLGGSFFFQADSAEGGNPLKLFTTLAFQLAESFPSMRTELNTILRARQSLALKSIETQFQGLIVEPLTAARELFRPIPVLVIDGLDECDNHSKGANTQRQLIDLIEKAIFDHELPLKWMVTSRRESWIQKEFTTRRLSLCTSVQDLQKDADAEDDIERFLTDRFAKIVAAAEITIETPWPREHQIDYLVHQASGQFIYPDTVLKFVAESEFGDPRKQLDIIMAPGSDPTHALSPLDNLYKTILSAYPADERDTLKHVLAGILVGANKQALEVVLNINPDDLNRVLRALRSLIYIEDSKGRQKGPSLKILEEVFGDLDDDDDISFSHNSFWTFLQDERRAGEFYINLKYHPVSEAILNKVFEMIHRNIDQQYQKDPHILWNLKIKSYHYIIKDLTFLSVPHCRPSLIVKLIIDLVEKLVDVKPHESWSHISSLFRLANDMEELIVGLQHVAGGSLNEDHEGEEDYEDDVLAGPQYNLGFGLTGATSYLGDTIQDTFRRVQTTLPLYKGFEVTPLFVYLTEYSGKDLPGFLNELIRIPKYSTSDVTSYLRKHRYLIPSLSIQDFENLCTPWYNIVGWDRNWNPESEIFDDEEVPSTIYKFDGHDTRQVSWPEHWKAGAFHLLCRNLGELDSPKWRTHGRWREIRIIFAAHTLKALLVLDKDESDSPHTDGNHFDQQITLARFFMSSISDISSAEYFQNRHNESIIKNILLNKQQWTRLCNGVSGPGAKHLIVSILIWLNRQLTNPETEEYLTQYRQSLKGHMARMMKFIFDHISQNIFKTDYPGLYGYSTDDYSPITIKVKPLPQGFSVEPFPYIHLWGMEDWLPFHVQVYEKPSSNIFIIEPTLWYSMIVSRLLQLLAWQLYRNVRKQFHDRKFMSKTLPSIFQCFVYYNLQPTPGDLDAIRAIVYFYPENRQAMSPKFWKALAKILERYDPSILSPEELSLFMRWLNDPDHPEIQTYIEDMDTDSD